MKEFQQDVKTWWLSGINLLVTADKAAGLEPLGVFSLPGLALQGLGLGQASPAPASPAPSVHLKVAERLPL